MKRSKSIRRALLLSILSIFVCTTMLTGTTLAWFTDTASTAVNTIQAGTLDIQMIDSNGNSLEGDTLTWQKAAGHENDPVLWEPGCTYTMQPVTIKNNGNLALKYKIEITGIQGSAKLNNAIDWMIQLNNDDNSQDSDSRAVDLWYHLLPGESQTLIISGHMKENAGNEYQGLTIDNISISVYAVQDTVEYDSNGNEYDADADNANVTNVYTYEQLVEALKSSGTIRLMNSIEVKQTMTVPTGSRIVLDMNGKTLFLVDGADTTCDPMIDMEKGSALTIDGNGTVDLGANPGVSFIVPRGDLTINSGTFSIDTGLNSYGAFFVGSSNGVGKLIINGGYFDGGFYEAGNCGANALHLLNLSDGQYVRVYGGTFVAQNPAWGDEANGGCACALHGTNRHLGWWVGTQGIFLEGQVWTDGRTDSDLPAGYTITEGLTADGRPTYTVNYTKP